MRQQVISLILFAVLSCFWSTPALSWEESSAANVLVFHEGGELLATFHLDDWTTGVAGGSVFYQQWQPGSSPDIIEFSLPFTVNSDEVAVPNMINGATVAPTPGTPTVSMYTFDSAIFSSLTPTGPGLSISQPSGIYSTTLAIELTALPWEAAPVGTYHIEVFEGCCWQRYASPHTIYLTESADIRARAVFVRGLSASYSLPSDFSYIINHPEGWNRDSDNDGFPDVWEVANGLNPLAPLTSRDRNIDSDNDGMNDIDELLRGADPHDPASPMDRDNDGWSDWDEDVRGTEINNPLVHPAATRLNEVEVLLSGTFSGGPGLWSAAPYSIQTLTEQQLVSRVCKLAGGYGVVRIPMGEEAFIRAIQSETDEYMVAVSRYLPMIPDPNLAEMTGEFTTGSDWQNLYEQFLRDRLVVTKSEFNVNPGHRAELALLARSLELEASLPSESWFGFGTFGHQPSQAAMGDLKDRLRQNDASINDIVNDFSAVLDSGCTTLRSDIAAFAATVLVEGVEEAAALYMHNHTGSYIAALLGRYSFSELNDQGWSLCEVLDPTNDLDNDSLPAFLEITVVSDDSDPFIDDTDSDGVNDAMDNCPAIVNSNQKDNDGDSIGDACDDDDDNDGLSDGTEMAFGSNPFIADTDNDGESDAVEWANGTHPGVSVYVTQIQSPTNQSVQTISGYRYPQADVYISATGGAVHGSVTYSTATSWSCEISNLTVEGTYEFGLQASLGTNWGYGSASILVDLTAPVVSISSPVHGSIASVDNPVFSFSADDGVVEVWLDGFLESISSGENLPRLLLGSHTVRVEVTDEARNVGFDEITFIVDESSLDRHVAVSSSSIDFGSIALGLPVLETIIVTNHGQTPVTLGNVGGGDSLASPFSVNNENCSGMSLGFEEICTVTIQVLLTEKGIFFDRVDLPNDDFDRNPLSVSVSAQNLNSFSWPMFLPAIIRNGQ